MLNIACVIKKGGDYTLEHVHLLHDMLTKHIDTDWRFVVFKDRDGFVPRCCDKVRFFENEWPSWWSKMELFTLEGPVLYFDLDTVIRRDITRLCEEAEQLTNAVVMLRDFYHGNEASGIMAWNKDLSWLTEEFKSFATENEFAADDRHNPKAVRCGHYRGDQDFIREKLRERKQLVVFAQDIDAGIMSYKADGADNCKKNASIICFHGEPRPWEITL